jgi:mannose-6-phosphate isomerase-like protein (cupin superfamily)
MPEPIPTLHPGPAAVDHVPASAVDSTSFQIVEWRGSGPRSLHIHHADDEAWHVLEGTLRFRFSDREVDVPAGGTMYVPAGVAHTYRAINARYLLVLTPRLAQLITELKRTPDSSLHPILYRRHSSTMLEPDA